MQIERHNDPFALGVAISALGPKNQDLVEALEIKNGITWRKKPYIHEWAIAQLHFGLKERFGAIDAKLGQDLLLVFEWMYTLNKNDFKNMHQKKEHEPLLLDNKKEIEGQILLLKDVIRSNDVNNVDYLSSLNSYLTDSMLNLREGRVFYGDGIVDSGELV